VSRTRPLVVRAGAALLVVLALSGCTTGAGPAPAPSSAAPEPGAEPTLTDASTGAEALAYFDVVVRRHLDGGGASDGRSMVDALVAAGFDKSAMQVTSDATSIGRAADSVQFSVLRGTDCLVGQVGGVGFSSQLAPALDGGSCLVGTTRAIDW